LTPEDEASAAIQEAQENTEDVQETTEVTEEPTAEPADAEAEAMTTAEEVVEPTPEPTATTEPEETEELSTPVPTPELLVEATVEVTSGGAGTYVVKAGDNLFRIAVNHGVTLQALSQANNITNPALIYVGQELTIPGGSTTTPSPSTPPAGQTCSSVYVVQPGDNLFRIALRHNYSQMYLAQVNGISNPSLVYVGQQLCIP
jgi:LysM repeat protein